jgi:hypothetical protein
MIKKDININTDNLVYVGKTGLRGGTIHSSLTDHLNKRGWQTAFRRKILEHQFGIPEDSRSNEKYVTRLNELHYQISSMIEKSFAFKYLVTTEAVNFGIWLIHKYSQQLWNKFIYESKVNSKDFTSLENELLLKPTILFSEFKKYCNTIPKKTGVYLIFKI